MKKYSRRYLLLRRGLSLRFGRADQAALPRRREKRGGFVKGLGEVQATAPILVDFRRLFPGAKEKLSYFSANDEPGFDLEVYLYDRYELTLQLPVSFDVSRTRVTGFGEPAFYLNEVSKILVTEGRVAGMSFDPTGALRFGSKEWRRIVENNGDFEAIGYPMKTDRPIADFKLLKR